MTWQDALFNPGSIAFVGLSNDPAKLTGAPLDYLLGAGFTGSVQIVNPRLTEIQGWPCRPDILSLERPVDHIYLLVNGDDAARSLADCAAVGAKVVTILAGGFSDAGPEGLRKQQAMVEAAHNVGLRLVGPNSLGVANLCNGAVISASSIFRMKGLARGRVALLSQSGGMMGALISRAHARGIGFSKVVSVGNEADLGVGEIGQALVTDLETDVFILFLESIRSPDAIADFARRASQAGKPILAYKLGRSEMGREMAVSHTGAIVGSDSAADAFLRQLGIVRVDHFETLIEAPMLFAGRRPQQVSAPSIGVVATTGGGAALVVDALGARGANVQAPSEATVQALAKEDIRFDGGRVVDLTLAGTKTVTVTRALDIMRAAPEFDLILAVLGSSSQFHPEIGVQPIAACAGPGKPVVAFLGPDAQQGLAMLSEASVAAFRTPEACADAIHAFMTWRQSERPATVTHVSDEALAIVDSFGGKDPNEFQAGRLFASLGVPMVDSEVLSRQDSSASLPFPLAVKVLSADIAHKTEAGGVMLNVRDQGELVQALKTIASNVGQYRPSARIDGFLAQPMTSGLAQVLIGYRRDPQVGPVVTLAAGGVLAELYKDSAVRPAPVDCAQATEMITEVKSLALLGGYRNLPKGDLRALADVVVAISGLAAFPEIQEGEVNPVLIKEEGAGAVAVDALISLFGGKIAEAASAAHD